MIPFPSQESIESLDQAIRQVLEEQRASRSDSDLDNHTSCCMPDPAVAPLTRLD